MMDGARSPYDDQARLWNGPAGAAWVDQQPLLDRLFLPLEALLIAEVLAERGGRVLDVGCGTGATTLAVARRLGPGSECVGVDVSDPMIALARLRAAREGSGARFVCADAQTRAFTPASFDTIVSRFGVMFFDDPAAAFANLRGAASPGAALRCLAWRSAAENPFMTTAELAAAPLLPNLPARRPDGPGQFAFGDPDRVRRILAHGGWGEIEIRPVDAPCALPEAELIPYLTRLGSLGLVLQEADEQTRARVVRAARAAFEPYVHGSEARFTAACWMICARAPSG